MKTQMTLAAIAALLASNIALAEVKEFKVVDADGNGSLSSAEYATSGAEMPFAELDADKNGSINAEEFAALEECD